MKPEKVLSLDVSSKTGWSFATVSDDGIKLVDYGTIPKTSEPDGRYPGNYVTWAYQNFGSILELIKKYNPDVLVIEETSKGSKNGMSQKILEFTHFLLAQYIKDSGIKSVYLQTETWRREIGCKMTEQEKARNKEVKLYKKKHKTSIAYDINGKRIGKIGRKHLNVRRANEIFGDQLKEPLRQKNEDLADSLGLLACYYQRSFGDVWRKREEVSIDDIVKGNL